MPTAGGLMNTNDLLLIAARQRPSLSGDKIGNTNGTFSQIFLCFLQLQVANHSNALLFHQTFSIFNQEIFRHNILYDLFLSFKVIRLFCVIRLLIFFAEVF